MKLASLALLHAGGIGWDEIAATLAIAGVVALIAYWIDRGTEPDDTTEPTEQ